MATKCVHQSCKANALEGSCFCRLHFIQHHPYTRACSQRQQEVIAEYEVNLDSEWLGWGEAEHIQSLKNLLDDSY